MVKLEPDRDPAVNQAKNPDLYRELKISFDDNTSKITDWSLSNNPPQSLTCTSTRWGGEHRRWLLVEAMPSVKKTLAEVSPRALREVDRLSENSEKGMANAGSEDLSSLLFNLENIQS